MFHFFKFRKKTTQSNKTHSRYRSFIRGIQSLPIKRTIAELLQMSEKLQNLPLTNFNLGVLHFQKSNLRDAILRFRLVNFLDPQHAKSRYYLGRCLMIKQANEKARLQFEAALELEPEFTEARYFLNKLTNQAAITEVPKEVIERKYSHIAKSYRSLEEESQETYRIMVREFLKLVEDKNPNLEILDLGCATGMCGQLLQEKAVVKRVVGVEMSTYNVERARLRYLDDQPVYDQLVECSAVEYIHNCQEQFDAMFVSGLLYAFRDPTSILNRLVRCLHVSSYIVFVKHHMPDTCNELVYFDKQADHFYHSKKLLVNCLSGQGFSLLSDTDVTLCDDKKGQLLIFRR